MRVAWVVAVLVLFTACATSTQGVDRARRWPSHRKETDRRFADLERRAGELEKQNATLEKKNSELAVRVQLLEKWIENNARRTPEVTTSTTPPPTPAAP